jgi:hypothetical protein
MQVYPDACRSKNEPGRTRIPLPVKVVCVFVLGMPGCGCQQIAQRPNPTPPAPNITSLSVTSGPVGKPLTITGRNFGAGQATSTVKFSGTAAKLTNSSPRDGINLTGADSSISVTISPVRGGITVTQPLRLTASVLNDSSNSGVTWTASGGILSDQMATSAVFTATVAGVYTITATSKADVTRSAAANIGVTDLAAVATWRNDRSRSGVNSREYALTGQNVMSDTFGKLFSCPVDGWAFAQPLWMANVSMHGTRRNVVFIATENDSLYAFDADGPGCKSVWSIPSVNLIPSGEKIAPLSDLENDSITLGPVTGITGTPVIDPSSQTIYLVAVTENLATGAIIQRLHAIDIKTGQERPSSPVVIASSIRGTGYDNIDGAITFAAKMQKQRAGLLLQNGVVYICWAGYNDTDFYHGWVIGYRTPTLTQVRLFNDTIDGGRGGIWMSGGGPAADSQGHIYLLTGNGDFNANNPGGRNYGDTFLKLGTSGGLSVSDWFTPFDQMNLAAKDLDLSSGVILLDHLRGPFPHLVLGGGKSGALYVVNRDNFGHYIPSSNSQIVQSFIVDNNGIYSTPLFWQNALYVVANLAPVRAFPFSPVTGQFQTSPSSASSQAYAYTGATPALSAAGTNNAILWVIDPATPGVLHAYDPSNLNTEFWNSSQAANNRDQAGTGIKFAVPTIANGKAYIGTQTELDVYGLLPN